MKAPVIQTQRLVIRPFQESDAQLWQVWDIDPVVQAYMPEPVNKPQDITEHYRYIQECQDEADGYYWSIANLQTDSAIGIVALTELNQHHKLAELGIVIGDKDLWGKGFATEAIKAVAEHAFAQLDIERISAQTEAGNDGIVKVLEKVGFKHEGTARLARVKKGQRIDVKQHSLLKGKQK